MSISKKLSSLIPCLWSSVQCILTTVRRHITFSSFPISQEINRLKYPPAGKTLSRILIRRKRSHSSSISRYWPAADPDELTAQFAARIEWNGRNGQVSQDRVVGENNPILGV